MTALVIIYFLGIAFSIAIGLGYLVSDMEYEASKFIIFCWAWPWFLAKGLVRLYHTYKNGQH